MNVNNPTSRRRARRTGTSMCPATSWTPCLAARPRDERRAARAAVGTAVLPLRAPRRRDPDHALHVHRFV